MFSLNCLSFIQTYWFEKTTLPCALRLFPPFGETVVLPKFGKTLNSGDLSISSFNVLFICSFSLFLPYSIFNEHKPRPLSQTVLFILNCICSAKSNLVCHFPYSESGCFETLAFQNHLYCFVLRSRTKLLF